MAQRRFCAGRNQVPGNRTNANPGRIPDPKRIQSMEMCHDVAMNSRRLNLRRLFASLSDLPTGADARVTDAVFVEDSVVLVGGREELPSQSFTSVARLDLFDLTTSKWLTDYDMQGALTHRIGHSVVTVQGKAYAFGGEQLADCAGGVDNEWPQQLLLGDVFELSYADNILRCDEISSVCGDGNDPNAPPVAAPSERAWHASAAVCFPEATSSAESPHTQGVLVLGGKDAHGAILSDVWLLALNTADQKPRWTQLTVR
ncbi:hypothetical protein BBJ28_00004728 [Nothophytophthora sp. Chile5]|nr:hypothetical protein BBJ28_00004728 [Nothophytophthora sp. Chile5]